MTEEEIAAEAILLAELNAELDAEAAPCDQGEGVVASEGGDTTLDSGVHP